MLTTAPLCATILRASLSTSASSPAGGATRFTRPQASAVFASIRSPVKSISRACLRARLRATPTPGVVQKIPLLIPGSANCATSLATARSHMATSWQPAATATPCTRAITGWGRRTSESIISLHCSKSAFCQDLPGCARISRRSCPAQKCLPAPARTTSFASSSFATRSSSACSAESIAVESGFIRSPRLSVKVATPSLSSRSTQGASTSFFEGAFMAFPLLYRLGGLRLLPQQEFLDFSRGCLRQHSEHHVARRLEAREVRTAVVDDLLFGDLRVRFQLDERARRFAPLRVGLRDHCRREHRRVPVEHVLDLQRRNVLAAGDDDVLGAVLDLDVAVGLHHREIARAEPAAREGVLGRPAVLEVALHGDVAAEHDLAHALAVRGNGLHGLRIHHRQSLLHEIAHPLAAVPLGALADIEALPFLLLRAHGRGAVHLGEPVHVGELPTHALHPFDHGGGRRRSRHHGMHLVSY